MKTRIVLLVGVAVALGVLGGIYLHFKGSTPKAEEPATAESSAGDRPIERTESQKALTGSASWNQIAPTTRSAAASESAPSSAEDYTPVLPTIAEEDKCPALHPDFSPSSLDQCVCGPSLKNVKATPRQGIVLVAACGLTVWEGQRTRYVDLAKEPISLDQDTEGSYPQGTLYFTGRLTLTGAVQYEYGDAGGATFIPDWGQGSTPLEQSTYAMRMHGNHEAALQVTDDVRGKECMTATAKVVVDNYALHLEDTDHAGFFPLTLQVLEISPYRECPHEANR